MQTASSLYRGKNNQMPRSGFAGTGHLIFKNSSATRAVILEKRVAAFWDCSLADALPGLATAEHAAECATLNFQGIGALNRDRRIVVAAAVGIVNRPVHFEPDGFMPIRIFSPVLTA